MSKEMSSPTEEYDRVDSLVNGFLFDFPRMQAEQSGKVVVVNNSIGESGGHLAI